MHDKLAQIDPESAQKIHRNDPQRIGRALEVYRITGQPLSRLQSGGREGGLALPVLKLVLAPEQRAPLRERIAQRFQAMLEAELVAEVRGLYERGDLHAGLPSMRLVGYRQVWRYLDGRIDYNSMISKAITATRQLAKRQLTWIRSERDAVWFNSESDALADAVMYFLQRKLFFH